MDFFETQPYGRTTLFSQDFPSVPVNNSFSSEVFPVDKLAPWAAPKELECESLLGTWNDNGHKLQSQSSFNSNQLIAHFRWLLTNI